MKNKIFLLGILCALISFSALSQTTEKSSTPRLDKFRQLKQNSRDAAAADTAATPVATTVSTNNIKPSKAVSSPSISSPSANVQGNKTLSATIQSPSPVDSTSINESANATTAVTTTSQHQPQQQAQVQPQPEKKTIYRPTRLGSSSRLYDTYEKNDNGAGSVTTSPK